MNNYHLQLLIGEGSFGRVYKATEKKNDKIVALKVIAKVYLESLSIFENTYFFYGNPI